MNDLHDSGAGAPVVSAEAGRRRAVVDPMMNVRASDLEPYTGLRYLSTLFRVMAILLVVLLVAEAVAGFAAEGRVFLPTLLAEASRLLVLAGILWGAGDLAVLLVDIGHDVRASRILLGRQSAHLLHEHHEQLAPADHHSHHERAPDPSGGQDDPGAVPIHQIDPPHPRDRA